MVLGAGNYPAEFNPKVHGPYNPSLYYGKPDTPFTQVKLGEMMAWISRRNFQPLALVRGASRGYWRWAQTWMLVKKPTAAPVIQILMASSLFFYLGMHKFMKAQRHTKYH